MDRITKSLIEAFLKEHEIESEREAIDFEKFCNYCVISREYPETFKVEDVSVDNRDVITTVSFVEQLKKRLESEFSKINSK